MAATRRKRHTTQPASRRLRVSYAEAQRVRQRLLSADVETLSKRDVSTLLTILHDVYPPKSSEAGVARRHPMLLGMGIGLLLILGIAVLW